jgi:hypothetical protein
MFVISLVLLNMVVGILCEVISVVSRVEKEELMVRFVKDEMNLILTEFDANGDDHISQDEFLRVVMEPHAVKFLNFVGVDVVALVEYKDVLFKKDKVYSFHELITLILDLRGSNNCTVKDVVDLRKWIDKEFDELHDKLVSGLAAAEKATEEASESSEASSSFSDSRRTFDSYFAFGDSSDDRLACFPLRRLPFFPKTGLAGFSLAISIDLDGAVCQFSTRFCWDLTF